MFADRGRQRVCRSVRTEIDHMESTQLQQVGDDAQTKAVMFPGGRGEQDGIPHVQRPICL